MFEQKNEPFQMRGRDLAVDAVEGMSNGVDDSIFRQISLELENVAAEDRDILMLGLRDAPDQHVNLTRILRKIRGNLFANKRLRPFRNRQATINAVVIRDGDKIHPALPQLRI